MVSALDSDQNFDELMQERIDCSDNKEPAGDLCLKQNFQEPKN